MYAAGDAVDFPVKQGGLAAQQADTVAEHVAASYGASVEPSPFRPALRGMLFTGGEPLYHALGRARSRPGRSRRLVSAVVAADEGGRAATWRRILFARGEEEGFGGPPIGFIDVDIPLSAVTLPG